MHKVLQKLRSVVRQGDTRGLLARGLHCCIVGIVINLAAAAGSLMVMIMQSVTVLRLE